MDIANLRAFVAVAESCSFSLAAERLHLTQPAVSKRIQALEASLDTRLLDRIGRRIVLTEAGRELLPRARHILLELEDSRRAIANQSGREPRHDGTCLERPLFHRRPRGDILRPVHRKLAELSGKVEVAV